jgi:hypothetical protein
MCRMNKFIKFLTAPAIMLFCMVPAFAEDRATLGSCLAAIAIAEAHDNEWQEPAFTPDECAVIAGKAVDSGFVLMNPGSSKEEIDHAIRTLSGRPETE